uniref:Small ribosomal subunit protein uS9c n=1 Tax=Neochloris aquatica TaxID=3099 RepID=A0A140H9K8_9CHLO|nr:ribosomal protein S9 [Neochloris aquatica]AMO00857.1 ribosomal protein S9 [Neochloris aquatica]
MEILARSIGRRKEAIATLKILKGTGKFLINNKNASDYLHNNSNNLMSIQAPLEILQKHSSESSTFNSTENSQTLLTNFDILVKVEGGGLVGQAEAIKLAVARAVCLLSSNANSDNLKKSLKDRGYLTQDARVKERRKYGLRKARKAPQYNKR